MKKRTLLCVGCFLFLASLLLFWEGWAYCKFPHNQTEDSDDSVVEREFQRVFSRCLGYTLIGEKPLSIEYCCGCDSIPNPDRQKKFFNLLEKMFNGSSRFLLKIFRPTDFYSEIILINKKSLFKIVKKNGYLSDLIRREYGSYEVFYKVLKDPKIHIVDCFKRDVIAIGIALGYGEKNSRYYERYLEVGFYLKKYPLVCLLPFDPKPMPEIITESPLCRRPVNGIPYEPFVPKAPASDFESLDDEWRWMRSVRNKDYDEIEIPCLFQLPFFVSKKCPETDKICQRYRKGRDRVVKLFSGRRFDEVVAEEAAKE